MRQNIIQNHLAGFRREVNAVLIGKLRIELAFVVFERRVDIDKIDVTQICDIEQARVIIINRAVEERFFAVCFCKCRDRRSR